MFVIDNENTKVPIKVWLKNKNDIEQGCLEQAYNLSNLPFIHKWVALMPDTHLGMGMPIGGVIAAKDVIVPNAVGVDIGCGMAFVGTNIKVKDIIDIQTGSGTIIEAIVGDIMRNIPVGFNRHRNIQRSDTLDKAKDEMHKYESQPYLCEHIDEAYYQVGTLGGGNHFIELQEDQDGYLGIMVHSGSRNFGLQICEYFNDIAVEENIRWHSMVPKNWQLAFLPISDIKGQDYISWMKLALDFAKENRSQMMANVKSTIEHWIGLHTNITVSYDKEINSHHNYAALENHYSENVWVHRKGAIRAQEGELVIIPGAMGSYSYIAMGLGNQESFNTAAHGAGRTHSRRAAMKAFTTQEVMEDLNKHGVVLGKHNKRDIAEESRFAYKNINEVMENQKDIVTPVKTLFTLAVVKG